MGRKGKWTRTERAEKNIFRPEKRLRFSIGERGILFTRQSKHYGIQAGLDRFRGIGGGALKWGTSGLDIQPHACAVPKITAKNAHPKKQ